MLRFYGSIVILVPALVTILTACEGTGSANGEQKGVAGAVTDSAGSNAVGMPSGAEAARNGSSGQGSAAASGQTPMQPPGSPPLIDAGKPSVANDAGRAPDNAMPDASVSNAMDAAQSDSGRGARPNMNDLSGKVLAMWGSSVCDGFSVPRGTGWPWLVEKKLSEINGPMVLHASTSGHTTDSKESSLERNKIKSANFVVICLSLGNQGLGDTATEASAQAVVDSYLDDIFTDDSDSDGDPVSLVKYIQSLGAYPIVTLVYPMAAYSTMHCQHVVKANILQQSYGIATVNHLGPTNAGNDFGPGDCTWSNGRNAPVNVESDARHPNQLGHEEAYYAFPPDLPFALASEIPFPRRPQTTDYVSLSDATGQVDRLRSEPIRYTPEYAMHSYTMQFAFQVAGDGTLAAVDLGMTGFLTIDINGGAIRLVGDDGNDAAHSSGQVTDNEWHDVALTYSYVRQKLALYLDGALIGEHDVQQENKVRELFPQAFIVGGPGASGRAAAPSVLHVRDLFINRTSLHAMEIKERATTPWVGAGSLDVYAPLRATAPAENRAQTLQLIKVQL